MRSCKFCLAADLSLITCWAMAKIKKIDGTNKIQWDWIKFFIVIAKLLHIYRLALSTSKRNFTQPETPGSNILRPIYYGSRVSILAEKKYSVYEKELLAILLVFVRHSGYLLVGPFQDIRGPPGAQIPTATEWRSIRKYLAMGNRVTW